MFKKWIRLEDSKFRFQWGKGLESA